MNCRNWTNKRPAVTDPGFDRQGAPTPAFGAKPHYLATFLPKTAWKRQRTGEAPPPPQHPPIHLVFFQIVLFLDLRNFNARFVLLLKRVYWLSDIHRHNIPVLPLCFYEVQMKISTTNFCCP